MSAENDGVGTAYRTKSRRKLHTRTDCEVMRSAVEIREESLDAFPEAWRDWCGHCGPEVDDDAE